MRIGLLADEVGITTEAIRYYERAGLLAAPRRTASGYRDYNQKALERLRFIRTAQTVGFTLGEIGEILDLRDNGQTPCDHVRQLIAEHAGDLQERIAALQAMQTDLRRLAIVAATNPEANSEATHCHILEAARAPSTEQA